MIKKTLMALAVIGTGVLGLSSGPAAAFSVPVQQTFTPALYQPAGVNINVQIWDRHRHGPRCRWRYGGCRYYYQGWWYQRPWWTYPPPPPRYVYVPRYSARGLHVRWCSARYRSYDYRTNTWISYSGHVRYCVSPYSG